MTGDVITLTIPREQPFHGVAPGQAAVLYDQGAVVGAGTILVDPAETAARVPALESEGE